ncbi:MAG: cellulase family glycosylhydrolase [Solirubrobacteraceae bacterium]|nr:cellulase family glycosylhydrolase [Solirubrobacteraceae bacterium]
MRRVLSCLSAVAVLTLLPTGAQAASSQPTLFEAPRELLGDDAALRASTAREIRALGADWVRVILYWGTAAPDPERATKPAFDERDPAAYPGLARYDAAIAAARAEGLKVLVTVSGPVPRWATSTKKDQRTRPNATLYGRFTEMLAKHYGAQVGAWSIWNEPNHPQFLLPQITRKGKTREMTAAKLYRQLFQRGEAGLAAGGSRAPVLLGETAPRGTATAVAPLAFLRTTLCLDSRYRKRSSCGRLKADGYAHHAYTTRGGPFFTPPSKDDVTIGVLSRLNSALAKAERAKALPRGTDVWLTEFGIQSWPDKILGVAPQQQAEYRSISEQIAYRNSRVKMFSQYLMRDDLPRTGGSRFGGFESGLRYADGGAKPSYEGFRLPLVASRGKGSTALWGIARPANGPTTVTIDYRTGSGGTWRKLKTDRTSTRGVWGTTTSLSSSRQYRVRWEGFTGPPTRSYRP